MLIKLGSILVFTIWYRGSRAIPSIEPAFFISLLSFFEPLAWMLPPQQMDAKQIVLYTTDF